VCGSAEAHFWDIETERRKISRRQCLPRLRGWRSTATARLPGYMHAPRRWHSSTTRKHNGELYTKDTPAGENKQKEKAGERAREWMDCGRRAERRFSGGFLSHDVASVLLVSARFVNLDVLQLLGVECAASPLPNKVDHVERRHACFHEGDSD